MITDGSGSVMGTEDHLPFGEDTGTGTGEGEKHRFTTYERDGETNTDYAVNRQHQYVNGRFLQPDPLAGSITNPQSLNRYSYVLNDPVNLSDPLGLESGVLGANHSGRQCVIDGFDSPCWAANALLGMDAAVRSPADTMRWNPILGEFEFFRGFADGSSGWQTNSFLGWSALDIRRALQSTRVLGVRVTSADAWQETLKEIKKIANALGGKIYVDPSDNVTYIIDVDMSYDEVTNKLESLGFSWFPNLLPTHLGGSDYAANKAPWFHLTVGYPYGDVERVRPRGFIVTGWGFRPDLTPPWITIHIDEMNPRYHWLKYIRMP